MKISSAEGSEMRLESSPPPEQLASPPQTPPPTPPTPPTPSHEVHATFSPFVVTAYRLVLLMASQLAAVPIRAVALVQLNAINAQRPVVIVGPCLIIMGAIFSSMTYCYVRTSRASVVAQLTNAFGVATVVLGLVEPSNQYLWIIILVFQGMSDISPFVNSTLGQNGEDEHLLRLYSLLSTAADMLATGTARMLGGVLLDSGGSSLLLGFILSIQVLTGLMCGVYSILLWQRRRAAQAKDTHSVAELVTLTSPYSRLWIDPSGRLSMGANADGFVGRASMFTNDDAPMARTSMVTNAEVFMARTSTMECSPGEQGFEDETSTEIVRSSIHRRMTRLLGCVFYFNGYVAGVLSLGSMQHFEVEMDQSKSFTGLLFLAASIIGGALLLIQAGGNEKLTCLKPPLDFCAFQLALTLFFTVFSIFPVDVTVASVCVVGSLSAHITNTGLGGRIIQAYISQEEEGSALVALQIARYSGVLTGMLLTSIFEPGQNSFLVMLRIASAVSLVLAFVLCGSFMERIYTTTRVPQAQISKPQGLRGTVSQFVAQKSPCIFSLESSFSHELSPTARKTATKRSFSLAAISSNSKGSMVSATPRNRSCSIAALNSHTKGSTVASISTNDLTAAEHHET